MVGVLNKIILPSVKHHSYLWVVPKGFRITPQYMKWEIAQGTLNKITGSETLRKYAKYCEKNNLPVEDPKNPKDQLIGVRVLSPYKLPVKEKSRTKHKEKYDKLIIHIHGGGFVASNSNQCQPFTRL